MKSNRIKAKYCWHPHLVSTLIDLFIAIDLSEICCNFLTGFDLLLFHSYLIYWLLFLGTVYASVGVYMFCNLLIFK